MSASPLDVAIIGTGFSGLGMAIRLKQAGGFSFRLFEKADDLGGTWRENRYPGCACDVQSHVYSFEFEPNPKWTRMFAPQEEIWDYLRMCAKKYEIEPHIQYRTRIVGLVFDEGARLWRITAESGETFTARVVVSGMGGLHIPSIPDIPGRDRFRGRAFHSAQWDHDYDLDGRRVAVIGTGASAIQFVPRIAPRVRELTLFQRTPPWIIPKPDRAISGLEQKLFERLPALQQAIRSALYWQLESRVLAFVLEPRIMKLARLVAARHIANQIEDPILRAKVTPDYAIGCKRILISDDYYPALTRPHVHVVTDAIREIVSEGVVTADGRVHEVDALLFGTGFRVQEPVQRGAVFGRGGKDILDAWPRGPEAYLGINVSGFPNLFFLMGPNTALGHNSVVYMIESQIAYVMDALRTMKAQGLEMVDVRPEVQASFNDNLERRLARSIWSSGCKSWYVNEHGKNTTLWPGFTFKYRQMTSRFDPSKYETR